MFRGKTRGGIGNITLLALYIVERSLWKVFLVGFFFLVTVTFLTIKVLICLEVFLIVIPIITGVFWIVFYKFWLIVSQVLTHVLLLLVILFIVVFLSLHLVVVFLHITLLFIFKILVVSNVDLQLGNSFNFCVLLAYTLHFDWIVLVHVHVLDLFW